MFGNNIMLEYMLNIIKYNIENDLLLNTADQGLYVQSILQHSLRKYLPIEK